MLAGEKLRLERRASRGVGSYIEALKYQQETSLMLPTLSRHEMRVKALEIVTSARDSRVSYYYVTINEKKDDCCEHHTFISWRRIDSSLNRSGGFH